MNPLRISLIQANIRWEDKESNLDYFGKQIEELRGKSDLVVLPETFSTGFTMNAIHLAETIDGLTMQTVKRWAKVSDLAITGSFIAREGEQIFNRGFFVTPEGEAHYYDKRHLFRMGEEHNTYTPGDRYHIVAYKGWNIRLAICYDLRFPVWLRNVDQQYDLLILTANWPKARVEVWEALLKARAIENQCYVCGVNRIGEDGNQLAHNGKSMFFDFKGKVLAEIEEDKEAVITQTIDKESLQAFLHKFPAWMDADRFEIK